MRRGSRSLPIASTIGRWPLWVALRWLRTLCDVSIAQWIYQWADTDRIAFWFEGESTTYRELSTRIDQCAHGLIAAGVGRGDRVGFCGLNRIELFEALFASARIGATFVPFNNRLTAVELAVLIEDAGPTLLLATDGFDELLAQAGGGRPTRNLDADPFSEPVADLLLADPQDQDLTVLMVYTSGTTGQAKGAMLTHQAMHYTVLNSVDHQGLTGDDCIVAPLPTFHVGGINIQTLPTLFVGGQVLLQRGFDPAGVLNLIEKHGATQTLLVPAMLAAVAVQPAFADTDLSSLRGINSGSSIVPADLMQPFFDRGVPVGQVYGSTETGPTAIVLNYADAGAHMGSCGKPALHTELRIVDGSGDDVELGSPGELLVRGPNIFSGYWGNPEATEQAFASDGWFRTGDVGYQDEAGFVFISDRIKDMVISGGENVYPAELEPILMQHPAIAEVAVIGEPDAKWGEIPVAVVVLAPGAALVIDELREWCQDRLARFKQPRGLRVVTDLPRTALGKVKKHDLRS